MFVFKQEMIYHEEAGQEQVIAQLGQGPEEFKKDSNHPGESSIFNLMPSIYHEMVAEKGHQVSK